MTSELATHLAAATAGFSETIIVPTGVPPQMQGVARRIVDDHRAMAALYQVEYRSPINQAGTKVEVGVARPGATVQISFRRSF